MIDDPHAKLSVECSTVVAEILRLQSQTQDPLVVALDGASGSGKTTLASLIESELDVAVITLDDFFSAGIPDKQWDSFSVAERLRYVFDWRRVRDNVLIPLLSGEPARWHAFDFESGLRADGTYGMLSDVLERTPADVVLIEGAYSAGPALVDLVDLTILVDVPVAVRHTRLEAREDEDFLKAWHERWDPVEAYYFNYVRPKGSFNLVLEPYQAGK